MSQDKASHHQAIKPPQDPFKVINYDNFDFEGSSIIKPKIQNFDAEHSGNNKKISVVIYSNDRNKLVYANPNQYVVELPDELQDVLAVEMVVSNVAFNPYNITSANNIVYVSDGQGGPIQQVVLEPGKYSTNNICNRLASKLNDLMPGLGFNITYDDVTLKFTVSASGSFAFHNQVLEDTSATKIAVYPPKSALTSLGFGCKVYNAAVSSDNNATYTCISEFACDLNNDNDAVVINVDAMSLNTSTNNVFNKSFAVMYNNNSVYESCTRTIRKAFNPPLARVGRMRLTFLGASGELYDFQNRDHILEFIFEVPKITRRYKAYIVD